MSTYDGAPIPPNPAEPPRKGGPEARAIAMELLADGLTVKAVAVQVGVDRSTVRVWRDSVEGQQLLTEARAARAADARDAREPALQTLKENAGRAAQVLVEKLASVLPFEALTASTAILDRVGIPRTERIETDATGDLDLSGLSDEDFAALRRIQGKLKRSADER